MNINDVAAPVTIPDTYAGAVRAIFFKQAELMAKYKEIEQLPSAPVSLHTASGQRVIKDFAWRAVEELTESAEAWEKHSDKLTAKQHAMEELADSVHFFVELCIFAGITPDQCVARTPRMPNTYSQTHEGMAYWEVVYRMGVAMNFLRNKAWKKSQVPTDEARCRAAILDTFEALMALWSRLGAGYEDVFTFYMRKSAVNEFRQRSNY